MDGSGTGGMSDWRQRLYDAYVSSGQAQLAGGEALNRYHMAGPSHRKTIADHMPADKSATIVDIGCGAGGFLYWLKQAGYTEISGYDLSPQMVEAAAAAGMSEVKLGEAKAVLASFPEGSLDVVVMMDVLEHLTREELFETGDLVYRALKPGGRFVAHVPNAEGIFGSRIRYADLTHELAFTRVSAGQYLSTVGFREVTCYEPRPIAKGLKSTVRLGLWVTMSAWYRLLHAAETGVFDVILSQNMLIVADK